MITEVSFYLRWTRCQLNSIMFVKQTQQYYAFNMDIEILKSEVVRKYY